MCWVKTNFFWSGNWSLQTANYHDGSVTFVWCYCLIKKKTLNYENLKFCEVKDGATISSRFSVRTTRPIFAVFHRRINTKRNGGDGVFLLQTDTTAANTSFRRRHTVKGYIIRKTAHDRRAVFIHLRIPTRNNFSSYIIIVQTPSYYKSLCGIPRARSRAFPYRYNTYVILL